MGSNHTTGSLGKRGAPRRTTAPFGKQTVSTGERGGGGWGGGAAQAGLMAKQVTSNMKYSRGPPPAALVVDGALTDPTTKPVTTTMVEETFDECPCAGTGHGIQTGVSLHPAVWVKTPLTD